MKESAKTAVSYVRSVSAKYEIDEPTAKGAVEGFVENLRANGLIVE